MAAKFTAGDLAAQQLLNHVQTELSSVPAYITASWIVALLASCNEDIAELARPDLGSESGPWLDALSACQAAARLEYSRLKAGAIEELARRLLDGGDR